MSALMQRVVLLVGVIALRTQANVAGGLKCVPPAKLRCPKPAIVTAACECALEPEDDPADQGIEVPKLYGNPAMDLNTSLDALDQWIRFYKSQHADPATNAFNQAQLQRSFMAQKHQKQEFDQKMANSAMRNATTLQLRQMLQKVEEAKKADGEMAASIFKQKAYLERLQEEKERAEKMTKLIKQLLEKSQAQAASGEENQTNITLPTNIPDVNGWKTMMQDFGIPANLDPTINMEEALQEYNTTAEKNKKAALEKLSTTLSNFYSTMALTMKDPVHDDAKKAVSDIIASVKTALGVKIAPVVTAVPKPPPPSAHHSKKKHRSKKQSKQRPAHHRVSSKESRDTVLVPL
eukprot:CAMPEP_0167766888 /NCGR_PEP_ID=MMETSP0110_2-20121227/15666_1 /TAXON_ID=629695 /ORGANISM="Gymnochlora sp., Strain CCMP2014" /LENGTH=348 /DNA_ID=CAMNT_0007655109 /DNA_START=29 /DNA_END=1071 /DNA_ORIENTATION=-